MLAKALVIVGVSCLGIVALGFGVLLLYGVVGSLIDGAYDITLSTGATFLFFVGALSIAAAAAVHLYSD